MATKHDSSPLHDHTQANALHHIQPYAALLFLDADLRIRQCSENIKSLLETDGDTLFNQPIQHYLHPENDDETVTTWLMHTTGEHKFFFWRHHEKNIPLWVIAYHEANGIIIECEPAEPTDNNTHALFDLTQHAITSLESITPQQSVAKIAQKTCEDIQRITGYDRVFVCQLNPSDYSETVIAEKCNEGIESSLGLTFMANDAPQAVRKKYLAMKMRYVPYIMDDPVKLIPLLNPITQTALDVSHTNLQAFTPKDLNYFTNVQMQSLMSIALIHDHTLCGFIHCQHRKRKTVSVNVRLILQLIATALATEMFNNESHHHMLEEKHSAELNAMLSSYLNEATSLSSALDQYHNELMQSMSATGMSFYYLNHLTHYGKTPTDSQVLNLIQWLKANRSQDLSAIQDLANHFPESKAYNNTACGILAIRLSTQQDNYLIFYRTETTPHITPTVHQGTGTSDDPDSHKTSPFEACVPPMVPHSTPWTRLEMKSADFIKRLILHRQLQDLLTTQAMHDPLTGLLNRLYMNKQIKNEIARASHEGKSIAFIILDIDHFKKINDQFGHMAGDSVLKKLGEFLKTKFRGYDYIYRYGGEEFLILLSNVTLEIAKLKTENLRNEIKNLVFEHDGKPLPSITVSAGVALYPDHGSEMTTLISSADTALYLAKKNGRDKLVVAKEKLKP